MTSEEEQNLRELGNDLAGAMQSPWQPRCIARAFARSSSSSGLALTMQGWLDLDALRSPIIQGALPETLEELAAAAEIFGLSVEDPETGEAFSTDELVLIAQAMQRACADAFGMGLKMVPEGRDASPKASDDDGFGDWLPLWACLVTQCGLTPDAALALRVDRAFALVAAMRRNQGWQVAGTPYALRDAADRSHETHEADESHRSTLNSQPPARSASRSDAGGSTPD